MFEFIRVVAVVTLVCVAAAIATPKGRFPLALRGVLNTLGRSVPATTGAPVSVRRRLLAFFLVIAAAVLACTAHAATAFRPQDYAAMRAELRAFYPDECHGVCKDPRQVESSKRIGAELDAWAAAHPGFDALDIRRESYLAMRRHFVPFVFTNSPFYFEAGVNGGWSIWNGAPGVPSRHVNRICKRFYAEKGLIAPASQKLLSNRIGERLAVCCGPFVDDEHHIPPFHTIFTKGFGGVRREVEAALAVCPKDDPLGRKELETALVGLDTIHEIQLSFARLAHEQVKMAGEGERRRNLLRIAESAARCPWEPPKTFFEGLNTIWFVREILGYVDGTCNFSLGRPDAWLIGLYRADIAAGRLTRAEADDLLARFLVTADCHLDNDRIIDAYSDQEAEIPMTLGGMDPKGGFVYNEITRTMLDAHLQLDLVFPKLHCRVAHDAPAEYLRKIGEMLMAGHAVFALFNDDRHIPQFEAMGYPTDRARDYVGCGCWDGNVDSLSDVDTANYISVARVLELTIHRDAEVERTCGLTIDPIDGAKSFAEVEETVYRNFIRFARSLLSEYTRNGRSAAQVFPHPVFTMCLEGAVKTRRDTTDGGAPFHPRIVTLAFMANVVDSLCAIRKLCFEDRTCTLPELLAAVRSNWSGERGEALRTATRSAPYWGDNSAASSEMMRRWINRFSDDIAGMSSDQGQPYFLACWIYREFMYWGARMKATPDGRRDGDRLAQGFAPSEYRCEADASTVMNAIGRIDHTRLYASNANLMFDREAMNPAAFEAVFRVECLKGMHLLQPNCTSAEVLLDAQRHPERHHNLIVKVCGFSARFTSLSKRWQDEVIARHRLRR